MVFAYSAHNNLQSLQLKLLYSNTFPSSNDSIIIIIIIIIRDLHIV
jgi:hypothetical protein